MTIYSPGFYDTIRSGCQRSAAVVAPIVHKLLEPRSVIDVGCGEGWWALAFKDLGCVVTGVDGHYVEGSPLGEDFIERDIGQPLNVPGNYDLVVCLEVAEHLPPGRSMGFIADLVRFNPRAVLFSAAIPGQGGNGHVNCRWQSYWAELLVGHGYRVTGALRNRLWHDEAVEPWYRQNLLLAIRNDVEIRGSLNQLFDHKWSGPLDIVHPEIWKWYR